MERLCSLSYQIWPLPNTSLRRPMIPVAQLSLSWLVANIQDPKQRTFPALLRAFNNMETWKETPFFGRRGMPACSFVCNKIRFCLCQREHVFQMLWAKRGNILKQGAKLTPSIGKPNPTCSCLCVLTLRYLPWAIMPAKSNTCWLVFFTSVSSLLSFLINMNWSPHSRTFCSSERSPFCPVYPQFWVQAFWPSSWEYDT